MPALSSAPSRVVPSVTISVRPASPGRCGNTVGDRDAPAVAQYYFPTVILRDQAGTDPFPVEVRGSVHMCNKAQCRAILIPRCGRNDAVHVAGVGKAHCRDAEFCHLIAESLCQYQLAGSRGTVADSSSLVVQNVTYCRRRSYAFHFRLVLSLRVHRSPLSPLLYPMFTKKQGFFADRGGVAKPDFRTGSPRQEQWQHCFSKEFFRIPCIFLCRYGRMGRKNGCNREEARL